MFIIINYDVVVSTYADTLKSKYCGDSALGPEELESLKDENVVVHSDNEEKVWSFLQTRVSLLLKAYPCSLEVMVLECFLAVDK